MSDIQLNDNDQQMADTMFLTFTNESQVYRAIDNALSSKLTELRVRIKNNIIDQSRGGASLIELFKTNTAIRENVVDAMIKYYLADPLMFTAKNRQDDYAAITAGSKQPSEENKFLHLNSYPKIKYHSPETHMSTKASPPVIKKQTLIGNVAIEDQDDEWLIAKIAELQNQQASLSNLKVASKSIKNKIAAFGKAITALVEELDSRDDSPAESPDPTA